MPKSRMYHCIGTVVLAVACLATTGGAHADTWLQVDAHGAVTLSEATPTAPAVTVTVADRSGLSGLTVVAATSGVALQRHEQKAGQFVELTWPEASISGEIGMPALPVIRRLFVAPAGASVSVSYTTGPAIIVDTRTTQMPGWVLPVQLPIEKVPGARENAQFVFDAAAYAANVEYAAERVVVEELGIVRGQRLCLLEIRPVSHNPAAGTLTFWPEIVAEVKFAGGFMPDDALNPLPGLGSIILNPEVLPNVTSRGTGNYLIVVASAYQSAIGTFAAAKAAQGYTVSTWVPTSASNTVIKNYITSLWGTASAPDYVLLVGDTDTIPHWTGGGEGSPATDIQYGCMDGSTDWYPDIAIGRFPVRNASQLQAIVDKTLLWENGPLPDPDYVKRAVFMASNDNYTVSEGTHNWVIQNYMIPNEIVSDKLYCHTYNATTQQVRNAFNNGRFFGIYSGHGAETYWADGPVFYASDVNNLTNVGMYPYVFSFACVTGTYTIDECFMETWVRAMNKGAVVAIGSSVNSYWTEDDVLEKRLFDSIYDEDDSVVPEAGPVLNDAKMRYLAQMGSGSTTRRYFEMYNIMGDPAMPFPGNCSDAGTAMLDSAKYACEDTASIRVGDCGLNTNDNVVETITVPVVSNSEPAGELVVLTETNANSALFEGSIALSATNAAGVLQVSAGDTLTVTYIDADNGQGQQVTVTATALVDCTPPTITNVHAADIQPRSAVITFDCDELASGTVRYGLSCSALNNTATGGLAMSPTISLSGLTDDTTYYYKVEAADEA
nr:C25 family cysteine peptidase [Candidatus Anammoximicrobium sp.]